MYKTILVPHAGTAAGDLALKHAIHAAKGTEAEIAILHVIEEIQNPVTFALAESERENVRKSIAEANESIKEEAQKEMEKRVSQCRDEGVSSHVKVKIGNAAEIVLDYVQQENVDLIVMAKRRKLKGVKKLLSLGSVSRKVIENVACPVLLIDIENL